MEEVGELEEPQARLEPLFKQLTSVSALPQEEGAKTPNPSYGDGEVLPRKLRTRFLQQAKPCVPLEEIDPYFRNKQTFIVIGRWGTIHRFSNNSQGYRTLPPSNAFRRLAIYLQTNWIFSTLIVATLLLNILALIKTQSYEILQATEKSWVVETMYIVDSICLIVYCFELCVKLIGRGLIGHEFSCCRDPWVWLDVLVIVTGSIPYHSFLMKRKAVVWIRLFKIIPLVPSIHHACRLFFRAVKQLRGMLILLVLFLWVFALLGFQLYKGTLTQICIHRQPEGVSISDETWAAHNRNMSNWYKGGVLCGNFSGPTQCPDGYVCLQGYGHNPDSGYTNFDNVFWSLLSVIRYASEDFTEELYGQVLSANGPWNILFFVAIFFFITVPMGCLFFATLGTVLTDSKERELEELNGPADVRKFEINAKPMESPEEELVGCRKTLYSFVYHDWTRNILIYVILIDIVGISSTYYGIEEDLFMYRLYLVAIPCTVFLVYLVEFLLKLIALGPIPYFWNRWNLLDVLVLLTFFFETQSYLSTSTRYVLAPIRFLKLVQYWPSLGMIFTIYYKTLKSLWGWVLYAVIVFAFLIFIAPFEIGQSEVDMLQVKGKTVADGIPRWSYIDFWHSFRMVVRMQIAEWIETLWDVLPYGGMKTFLYYLVVNLCGALLISFLLIGVVYTTVEELRNNRDPCGTKGLRFLMGKVVGIMYIPIQRMQPGAEEAIAAEPTGGGQLRKGMQDCTEHWAYKLVCAAIIIVASVAMIFETKDSGDDMQTGLFVTEILFTIIFFVIVVYELLSFGLKECAFNRGWWFDALIVVENILNLCIYQFSVTGRFRVGLFFIRSFRPLMLIRRVDWLKAPLRGLQYELKLLWEMILSIMFIWLLFDTVGVHWHAGLYHKCVDPESGDELRFNRDECISGNYTWEDSDFNFNNAGDGFLNMAVLVTRMGWISLINDGSDAVGQDQARQQDVSKFWLLYFITFVLCGGFGALGIIFSFIFNKFQEDKGYNIILTESQADTYTKGKTGKEAEQIWITFEDDYIPSPDAPRLSFFYNIVTNFKFDVGVMVLIILDNICLSLYHYQANTTFETAMYSLRLIIFLLFIMECVVKIICWGRHYFRSIWNYLDLAVILTGVLEIFLRSVMQPIAQLIRMLRLVRIFRFLMSKTCGSDSAKVFFSAIVNIRYAVINLLLFQLTVIWAYALFGTFMFGNVVHTRGLRDDWLNFRTFRSSLWTLIVLLGFPSLEGIYLGLANENMCDVNDHPETFTCGHKISAILFVGSYAGLTFIFLTNMYAVFITEIISEVERLRKDQKGGNSGNTAAIPLENVSAENEILNNVSGEI